MTTTTWWILGIVILLTVLGAALTIAVRNHFVKSSLLVKASAEVGLVPNYFKLFFQNPFTGLIIFPVFFLTGLSYVVIALFFFMNPVTLFTGIVKNKEVASRNFMNLVKEPVFEEKMVSKDSVIEFGRYYEMEPHEIEELYLEVKSYFRESSV